MEFIKTAISDVILIKPNVFGDERGFFMETYKKSLFEKNGISDDFIQDNHSKSVKGVLRGLHYQLNPSAQAKLVRCIAGHIFDVAVDIRQDSLTFGKWVGYELSDENKCMLYIPQGFAHGFLTLSDSAELLYKTNSEYDAKCDRGILYSDPELNIDWPILSDMELILSEKDKNQPVLKNIDNNFKYTR